MKKTFFKLLFSIFLWLFSVFGTAGIAQAMMLDRVLVVVNDDIITYGEFDQALQDMRSKLAATGDALPDENIIKEKAMEQLVFEKLLQLHAKETGINVSDDMLNAAVKSLAQQNDMSVPEILRQLRQDGMSEKEFRYNLKSQNRTCSPCSGYPHFHQVVRD